MAWTQGIALAFALLLAGTAGTGIASAGTNDVDDHVRLETGTLEDWGAGDYVALNMTQNGTLAFFGVVYGTEEYPNAIVLVSAYIQYLGGAEVVDEHGGLMAAALPIPVLTAHAQVLAFLVEFNDTGYPAPGGRVGAGNGLFDFSRTGSGLEDFNLTATEPLYKAVDLRRAWERSEITEVEKNDHMKSWEFALTTRDALYTRIWDNGEPVEGELGREGTPADGVVEKVEFRFHVGVDVTKENVQVPWYRVTLGEDNEILDSKEVGKKLYKGIGLQADFKYDHLIQGWDFTAKSASSRLMLESFIGFGTFVPDIVQRWMDVEFGAGYADDYSIAEVETFTGGPKDLAGVDDIPDEATLLTKDSIVFKDRWHKNGEISWVSDVEVDGKPDKMAFQIHAGDVDVMERGENDDGAFHGAVLVGGYIYPAGKDLFHDPVFSASAVIVDVRADLGILPMVIFAAAVASVVLLGAIGVAVTAVRRRERALPPSYGAA